MSYSDKFATFCNDLSFSNLPKSVIDRVKYFFLDYLGIVIRASQTDSTQPIHAFIKKLNAPGQATIIGQTTPNNALLRSSRSYSRIINRHYGVA